MLTKSQIERFERQTNEHLTRIHDTASRRHKSKAAWEAWENAARAWHRTRNPCFDLWPVAVRDKMQQGDREMIEDALVLLEVDPWFFRSGYLKARVIRHLKKAILHGDDRARLREVIRHVTQGRNRREFRDYCRLALLVWTPAWEAQLRAESAERDSASRGKYSYLLRFIDGHRDKLKT